MIMTYSNKFCLLTVALTVLLAVQVQAQKDFRANPPEPGPAKEIELAEGKSFELDNGLKVIVVEDDRLPRISYQVFVDVPPMLQGDKAGMADLAGQLLRAGTEKRPKAEIDEAIDFIGASLTTSSSGIFGSALSKHRKTLLAVMTEILYMPAFPQEEFDKLKKQSISGIISSKDSPDAIASRVADVLRYGQKHPYGETVTESTLENVTLEDCQSYYDTYFRPNISYLVIVGDISFKKAKHDAEKYFGDWAQAEVEQQTFPKPNPPEMTQVGMVDKAGAVQSVISVTHPVAFNLKSDDYIAARVMNAILGGGSNGRLYKNIREDKGYTYGAYSSLATDEEIGYFSAGASVRNEVTDSAIIEFMHELDKMRKTTVTQDELTLAKNNIAGSFARSLERPQTIANFALNEARYELPGDFYQTFLQKLEAVMADEVRAAARKYIRPDQAHIVVVGAADEVAADIAGFSADNQIRYYDEYGNPVEKKEMTEDISAQDVLDRYVDAIGGADRLQEVNDITMTMSSKVQNMSLNIVNKQKAPMLLLTEVKMNDRVVQTVKFDGETALLSNMQGTQKLTGEDAAGQRMEAILFPEMKYEEMGYEAKVTGIEEVNGADAYKLNVTRPDGSKVTEYYAKDSGYKVKEVITQQRQGQTITITNEYSDYREVDGIMVPYTTRTTGAMPVPIEMKVESVQINTGIEDAEFKIE